jgi:hypothetical protein
VIVLVTDRLSYRDHPLIHQMKEVFLEVYTNRIQHQKKSDFYIFGNRPDTISVVLSWRVSNSRQNSISLDLYQGD